MKALSLRRCGALALSLLLVFSLSALPLPRLAEAQEPLVATQAADLANGETGTDVAPVVVKYSGVGISKRAKVQGAAWSAWTDGVTIGKTSGNGLRAMRLRLTGLQGITGGIKYQTYKRGSGWRSAVLDGASSGDVRNVESVKIKLTGTVSKHYDVLYRVYMSGSGWRPWVKNGASAGLVKKNQRVNAVQVKLSPKTEEARGKSTSTAGVFYQARLYSAGWQTWKRDGGTSGKAAKRLRGLTVKVDTGDLQGGLTYRAYGKNGWGSWKNNGAYAGASGSRLEAIQVKLTGDLAKSYNVYYRAYVQGSGWLDWAKNGATSGSTGYNLRLEKYQVKLVKKGNAAPGNTDYPTVNKLEASNTLNGIDISSWQAGINVRGVKADFVIVKATGGTKYVNPYYKQFADAALASGKQIGFYHYAREDYCPGSAVKEAVHFSNKVKPYIGKAVLFLDFEGSALKMSNAAKWAKKFMDTVYKRTGVKPLIYMSQSVTWKFNWSSVAKKYGLWVAQYLYANEYKSGYLKSPTHWDIGYWDRETLYQYSSTAKIKGYGGYLDVNKFYGSVKAWKKLAQKS